MRRPPVEWLCFSRPMPESAADVHRAALESLVKPFRDQLAQVEAEIAQKDSELRELKEWRTKLTRMLAPLDPTLPRPGRKKEATKGRDSNEWSVRPETREKVEAWLRKTYPDKEFSAGEAAKRKDAPGAPETIRRTMMMMVDRGALRLDRVAAGGAKFYVFTGG